MYVSDLLGQVLCEISDRIGFLWEISKKETPPIELEVSDRSGLIAFKWVGLNDPLGHES
jgi:hypothetical protein